MLGVAIWWGFTTVACTVISAVINGLRRQVAAARKLGQYTLEQKLGEGGMGTVYRAKHALMQRPTALKLLSAERSNEVLIERFEREVQLTARLTHPNTITIFDYGRTADGVKVTVGSVPHPMLEEHYIEWIEIVADGKAYRQFLEPGGSPEALFCVQAQNITAREYCNLHGLWKG